MRATLRSAIVLAVLAISAPPAAAARRGGAALELAPAEAEWAEGAPRPLVGAAASAVLRGPLPADAAALARAKAAAPDPASEGLADAEPFSLIEPLPLAGSGARGPSPSPVVSPSWKGIDQSGGAPSDSTGAIGTTRYVEVVNSRVAVYGRSGQLLSAAGLGAWWNVGSASTFDPQVLWDPDSERFFYAGDAVFGGSDHRLAFGWSTSASPGLAAADWCRYTVKYGAEFPDYPKLGDSRDFLLIGVNVFSGDRFRGADVVAIGKPAPGTRCAEFSRLRFGVGRNLSVRGAPHFTPVPANQIDGAVNGWIVTIPATVPASSLGLFRVSRGSDGNPVIQTSGTAIPVPSYSVPRNAPQGGTRYLLDSGDARLTQAVSAKDPSRRGRVGIWTQHTVRGGAGAAVRWYEVDPTGRTVLQSGTVSSPTLYAFNGAISPDRLARGSARAFGAAMVLGYNTSSAATFPAIAMIGKRGDDDPSAAVVVKASPGPVIDFTCSASGVCRWGDYAAATPDPSAPTNDVAGRVWSTSAWTRDGRTSGPNGTSWQTWNWGARP